MVEIGPPSITIGQIWYGWGTCLGKGRSPIADQNAGKKPAHGRFGGRIFVGYHFVNTGRIRGLWAKGNVRRPNTNVIVCRFRTRGIFASGLVCPIAGSKPFVADGRSSQHSPQYDQHGILRCSQPPNSPLFCRNSTQLLQSSDALNGRAFPQRPTSSGPNPPGDSGVDLTRQALTPAPT